uniref:Ninja-family protein n=1 Tax=Davidia involucrata TaxID=16924 RepID=A0A5B6YI48_DAVIN
MGDADHHESKTSSGMEQFSWQTSRFPRDLLQRFMASTPHQPEFMATTSNEEGSEEIELNLGLSLGGRFGVDKRDKTKLIRSSSIAGSIPIVRDDDAVTLRPMASYPTLIRTSSLPTGTAEEWRKRKELQTLRRMEAKRRRSEKQRNLKSDKDGGGGGGGDKRSFEDERREIEVNLRGRIGLSVAPPFGLPTWAAAAAARQALLAGGIDAAAGKGKGDYMGGGASGGGGGGMQGFGQPSSQGSMESQGGSSSGMSELESKLLQGSSSCGEASPASIQSLQEQSNQEAVGSSGTKTRENDSRISGAEMASPSKRPDIAENRGGEVGANAMEDMPCVFTKGDGPNGRRIEGILYKYGKGEEVRIMCVCHGKFLSPAEFVKHAGGGDVAHPLKHIVVNPNSSSFL